MSLLHCSENLFSAFMRGDMTTSSLIYFQSISKIFNKMFYLYVKYCVILCVV